MQIGINAEEKGNSILNDEVRHAIRDIRDGKSPGSDGINIEMIKCLEEWGVDRLTKLFNNIYNMGNMPKDFLKNIFIPMPKKSNARECAQFRTICLTSHVLKVLLKILLNRIRTK